MTLMVQVNTSKFIVWFSTELEVSDLNETSRCIRANAFVLSLITMKDDTSVTLNALCMHPVEHYVKLVQARFYKQGAESGLNWAG